MSIAPGFMTWIRVTCENEGCNDTRGIDTRQHNGMIAMRAATRAAAVRAGLRRRRQGRGLGQGSPAVQDRPGGGLRQEHRAQPLRERPTGGAVRASVAAAWRAPQARAARGGGGRPRAAHPRMHLAENSSIEPRFMVRAKAHRDRGT